jgi:hypothetical protein
MLTNLIILKFRGRGFGNPSGSTTARDATKQIQTSYVHASFGTSAGEDISSVTHLTGEIKPISNIVAGNPDYGIWCTSSITSETSESFAIAA